MNKEKENNSDELKYYKNTIELYAQEEKDYPFKNRGAEHAIIVLPLIFKYANERIYLLANNLWNSEVVNTYEYISAIQSFLDKGTTQLKIMVSNFPSELIDNDVDSLYKMLCNHDAYKEGRVSIKNANGKNLFLINKKIDIGETNDANKSNIINFCTADKRMYRIETDIVNRKAECNFNDDRTVRLLDAKFEEFWNRDDNTVVNLSNYF